jgi:predicted phosphodiesterase
LSKNFPKVNVYFATGNHGRSTARHHGRATLQKWDSLETVIYYALKTVFANAPNMNFTLPLTPYVSYEVFNKKVFASHGDTVFNPGYPGKSINVGNLEDQTNRINASLKDDSEYSVFVVGHVHTASVTHLGNNAVMITNGALVPTDGYAASIGLLESNAGQMLFESVKDFPVGDTRFIRVSSKDDNNKELDKLIKPFESL